MDRKSRRSAGLSFAFATLPHTLFHTRCNGMTSAATFLAVMGFPRLRTTFTELVLTSLDVEREHNVVKQSAERQSGTPVSISHASRTHILQQYASYRREQQQRQRAVTRRSKRLKFMNAQALAVQEAAFLFPKGHGQLRWEKTRDAQARRKLRVAGDPAALREYLELHRPRLQVAAQRLRQTAVAEERELARAGVWPTTPGEWQALVAGGALQPEKRTHAVQQRRVVSARLQPNAALEAVAPRLLPAEEWQAPYPQWVRLLSTGDEGHFFSVRRIDENLAPVVLFVARTQPLHPWGMVIREAPRELRHTAHFRLGVDDFNFQPVRELLYFPEGVVTEVHRLEVRMLPAPDFGCFLLRCVAAHVVTPPPRRRRTPKEEEEVVDGSAEAFFASCACADSDRSVVSENEASEFSTPSDSDSHATDAEDADDEVLAPRAPRGTHTIESTTYWTLTDNRNYPECRIRFQDYWLSAAGGLGQGGISGSKTLSVRAHGEPRESPEVTYTVLRAWALWRMRQSPGWLAARTCRQAFWDSELARLRSGLPHLTLNPLAERRLREWAPEVLVGQGEGA